ncbi:hypothetical protein A3Q56_04937 [Intoshia linei]|uniref:PiggyBac transposable element-derived protein domain-containing protein n=1 Tax=Intoshia linei TaxID=1819745 RepID=A0A177B0R5_9BILA|nr:hypothetical protein A3Q56_04937 [Intoshia linei]
MKNLKVIGVYIEPPKIMDFTDKDSGDEDTVNYEKLTGNQLRTSIFTESEFYKIEQGSDKIKWTKQDLSKKNLRIFEKPISTDYSNMKPSEIFELFFDDKINKINISIAEMRLFFAILIISGYNKRSSRKSFWSNDIDLKNDAVRKAMNRDRPLLDHLSRKFMEHFMVSENISHEESMIEYFGKTWMQTNDLILKQLGYNATGTIRKNRIVSYCTIKSNRDVKKCKRGYSDHAMVKWNDNSVVSMLSTLYGKNTDATVKRWDRVKGIRGIKWWWSIFTWTIDVALQNSCILYRNHTDVTQFHFRRSVTMAYIDKYAMNNIQTSNYSNLSVKSNSSRYDGLNRFVAQIHDGKRRRCQYNHCKSVCTTIKQSWEPLTSKRLK